MYAFAFIHLLECVTIKVVVYREIYNGKRWRTNQLYKAPMGEVGDLRVFLNDFLYFTHPVPLVKFDIFSARCRNVEEGRYTQYYV